MRLVLFLASIVMISCPDVGWVIGGTICLGLCAYWPEKKPID